MRYVRRARTAHASRARLFLAVPVLVVLVVSIAFIPHVLLRPAEDSPPDLVRIGGFVSFPAALSRSPRRMPAVGLGMAGLRDTAASVQCAVLHGCQLLDTAAEHAVWYRNEQLTGELLTGRTPLLENVRSRVFVTTKIHPQDHGSNSARGAIRASLGNLDGHIDLLLIHAPRCWANLCTKEPEGTWRETWAVMEEFVDAGSVSYIGVSNFGVGELEELLSFATVRPAVVQNWFDPFHQDTAMRDFCFRNAIHFQGYSTLGTQWQMRGYDVNPVLHHNALANIAASYKRSVSQIVLRWALQEGVSVVPKSNSCPHIQENMDVLRWSEGLSHADMEIIRALDEMLGM